MKVSHYPKRKKWSYGAPKWVELVGHVSVASVDRALTGPDWAWLEDRLWAFSFWKGKILDSLAHQIPRHRREGRRPKHEITEMKGEVWLVKAKIAYAHILAISLSSSWHLPHWDLTDFEKSHCPEAY
jgi:hypothetical protein